LKYRGFTCAAVSFWKSSKLLSQHLAYCTVFFITVNIVKYPQTYYLVMHGDTTDAAPAATKNSHI